MNLQQFYDHISSFKDGTIFKYGISEPFQYPSDFGCVAFSILDRKMLKEDILERITMSLNKVFYGYKWEAYRFSWLTDVHFEVDDRSSTDGEYTRYMICKMEQHGISETLEGILVKLAFSNDSGGCA